MKAINEQQKQIKNDNIMYQIKNKKIGEKRVHELINSHLLDLTKFYTHDTPTKFEMIKKEEEYFFIIRYKADVLNKEVQNIYPISKTAYNYLFYLKYSTPFLNILW